MLFTVYCIHELFEEASYDQIIDEMPEPSQSPLKLHDYNWDNLKKKKHRMSYEDDNYTSMQGIDVSSHQEEIDWALVKEAGIEFAFIRAGYRGTTEGRIHDDEYFDANMKGAAENGIPVGVYFFSQAVTEEEALEEAEYTLERIRDYDVAYPVVFDMEEPEYEKTVSRAAALSIEEKTKIASVFLHRIRKAGYEVMIYDSTMLFEEHYDISRLQDYRFWVAEYGSYPRYDYEFEIWQYSESGKVKGISEPVDMDIWFKKKDD
ncbi:MAG: glycoside hydrolase family 25 protein [Solobacterium sp.]|nr:glycoside hydrolase family 25 protein [Solobacterium sp.]